MKLNNARFEHCNDKLKGKVKCVLFGESCQGMPVTKQTQHVQMFFWETGGEKRPCWNRDARESGR